LATRLLVLTQFFSFPVVRIADEHLRQNGVGPNKTCADAILPKGHLCTDYRSLLGSLQDGELLT